LGIQRGAKASILAAILCICGCSGGNDYYPLKVGNQWSYMVVTDFSQGVQTVKCQKSVPVAGTKGYELSGPMGISRLAWKGNTLYATALPNARLYKAIPMLIANDPKATTTWHGQLQNLGVMQKAEATLTQSTDMIDVGSKKFDTIKATLTVKSAGKDIVVETWYAKGVGPIRQTQRTGDKLNVKVDLLGGP
jgi:hypothetical protein